jgi:glycosyltransferase involved in cell wall biosynthesis
LLDRDVFFLDRWVPYEDRHRWLADADVGISLHRSDAEGELAARARYMDFLWARLPCVISDGGDIGRDLVRAGLAEAVPLGDPEAVAVAIEDWIDRKGRLSEREHDLQRLSGRHEWSTATEPLAAAIEGSVGCGRPPLVRLLREVIAFYLARVGWRLRGSVADRTSGLRVRAHRQNASRT